MSFNIAIDGPAGAGKSTIAKKTAKILGFVYVDTGAMYRSIALYMLQNQIDIHNQSAVEAHCKDVQIQLKYEADGQQVYLNGVNVSKEIRQEQVGKAASVVSAYPVVRQTLLGLQQNIAATQDILMDGRDIGTCVLPKAQLKIYLTASVHTRALRRYQELVEKGQDCVLEEIERDIEDRDYRDMHREIAPLKVAEDAVVIDSSDMTIDQVTEEIISLVNQKRC